MRNFGIIDDVFKRDIHVAFCPCGSFLEKNTRYQRSRFCGYSRRRIALGPCSTPCEMIRESEEKRTNPPILKYSGDSRIDCFAMSRERRSY